MNTSVGVCSKGALWRRSTVELQYPRCVASYDNYAAAAQAVDALADWGFPVREAAIVGRGLRSVERVTGPARSWATTIGALLGAWFGLFGALTVPTVTAGNRFGLLLSSIALGAVGGLIWAEAQRVLLNRNFVSATQVLADRYELVVEHHLADQARQLLGSADAPVPYGVG